MKKFIVMCVIGGMLVAGSFCRKAEPFSNDLIDLRLSGGAATTFLSNNKAFGDPIPGLSAIDDFVHAVGDGIFSQIFVSAPAPHFPGVGPIYNNISCISCHHNDGKGTPTLGQVNSSLLTRISMMGVAPDGGPMPVPGYGLQLQDKSNNGPQEAKVTVSYEEIPFTFADGETASLRKPTYTLSNPYKPLPADYMLSVRLAPPVFGLGLLELIPEATILSHQDIEDKDGDGISGKANYVYNPETKRTELGRFGLKANTPSVRIQVAAAFQQDMGITNSLFSEESSKGQVQDDKRVDDPELSDSLLDATVFYAKTLAVPARRLVSDSVALRGARIFSQIKCASCHLPDIRTGVDVRLPTLSNQLIHPYTDMLLHDMGEGLSDGRPDYLATGSEWRTMPLWGIGLFQRTNGVPYYLHDGRARTITEAILWHGGEAKQSKEAFTALSKPERTALLRFLNSL